eukprot:CAMPEP_0178948582 /NCGR_PEP_ID=MMETSP0789-20121207/5560_1 /TAXON_ID=3005 /ORGANISM="Rhizosolenia setigera, Strain CCMP 1694" /LENGTH=637 /DNA_ID=CAMNT_0020628979 /DNA_START=291 /DNA_END=2204 /DNA_ORIENTATION=-
MKLDFSSSSFHGEINIRLADIRSATGINESLSLALLPQFSEKNPSLCDKVILLQRGSSSLSSSSTADNKKQGGIFSPWGKSSGQGKKNNSDLFLIAVQKVGDIFQSQCLLSHSSHSNNITSSSIMTPEKSRNTATNKLTSDSTPLANSNNNVSLARTIASTPIKVASVLSRGITSILASYDIIDDPEYSSEVAAVSQQDNDTLFGDEYYARDEDEDNHVDRLRKKYEEDEAILQKLDGVVISDDDVVLNINLTIDCAAILYEFLVEKSQKSEERFFETLCEENKLFSCQNKVYMYKHQQYRETGSHNSNRTTILSWMNFCQLVGSKLLSTYHNSNDWKKFGQAKLLSEISHHDASVVLHAFTSAAIILIPSDSDVNLVALDLNKIPYSTNMEQNKVLASPSLSQADLAIWEMNTTKCKLSDKMESLQDKIVQTLNNAKLAQRQNKKQSAIIHMKRKKMYEANLEQTGNMLINIETAFNRLVSSLEDKEVIKAMTLCRDALSLIRTENADLETVEDLMDDIREDIELDNNIGSVLAETVRSASHITDEDLEKELEDLQEEMNREKENNDPGDSNNGNNGGGMDKNAKESIPSVPADDEDDFEKQLEDLEKRLENVMDVSSQNKERVENVSDKILTSAF